MHWSPGEPHSSLALAPVQDGSVDVYFGPEAPAGKENNFVQTVPGRGWNTLLRLYGPLEAFYNKTWRPGEIEEVAGAGSRALQ